MCASSGGATAAGSGTGPLGASTVTTADAVNVSTVAVTVAEPPAIAESTPVVFTVATAVLELVQAARLVASLLEPSLYEALTDSCCVVPAVGVSVWAMIVIPVIAGAGVVTVIVEDPLWEPKVAVIVALPLATAVTVPAFTLAMFGAELVQVADAATSCVVPSL